MFIDYKLGDSLCGAVKLNKNADPDKYIYCDYGIGFDAYPKFLLSSDKWGKNVDIFGVHNTLPIHIDNGFPKFLVKDQQMEYMILQQQ